MVRTLLQIGDRKDPLTKSSRREFVKQSGVVLDKLTLPFHKNLKISSNECPKGF